MFCIFSNIPLDGFVLPFLQTVRNYEKGIRSVEECLQKWPKPQVEYEPRCLGKQTTMLKGSKSLSMVLLLFVVLKLAKTLGFVSFRWDGNGILDW